MSKERFRRVCCLFGLPKQWLKPKSQTYLVTFVEDDKGIDDADLYEVIRAVGQGEIILEPAEHTKFDKPRSGS